MDDIAVWGIHTGRPRGSAESEQQVLIREMDEVFKKGVIAIGWPQLGDLSELPADRAAFKQRLGHGTAGVSPHSIANDATTLMAFVHEAQINDIVVYRSPLTNDIWLGHIRSSYFHDPGAHYDYVNRRRVSWACRLPAAAFSDEARRALGQQRSFFRIKNYSEEFRTVIKNLKQGRPALRPRTIDETGLR